MIDYPHLLSVWRQTCRIRFFEEQVYDVVLSKRVKCHVYLALGQELIPAIFSVLYPDATVFQQHRGHGVYLAFGGNPERLRDELLGLESGCTKGIGGSPCIADKNVMGHCGLIGDHIPVATGYAFSSGKKVLCFFGDGAMEEDYILPAMGFAARHKLDIHYICEDNNLSVLTPKEDRRNWKSVTAAKAMGLASMECDDIDFISRYYQIEYNREAKRFFNFNVNRECWHVGAGKDNPSGRSSGYTALREYLFSEKRLDEEEVMQYIKVEEEARKEMENLWNRNSISSSES